MSYTEEKITVTEERTKRTTLCDFCGRQVEHEDRFGLRTEAELSCERVENAGNDIWGSLWVIDCCAECMQTKVFPLLKERFGVEPREVDIS